MKKIIVPALVVMLAGCQSLKHAYYDRIDVSNTPESVEAVNVTYDFDQFEKEGWLTSDYYISWFESGTNGIAYKYRAFYESENANSPQFIQLYFVLKSPDWYFVDSVYNEKGVKYPVTLIDRDTANAGNVYEYFAIKLTAAKLQELTESDLRLKIVGKKGEEIFPVSALVAQSFQDSLKQKVDGK
ncbi:hypothetical protein CRN61_19735 [Vibrio vulnificus]|uniref:hypothetical protein n=1 Tax=Vibrio vulnificus TaxID=672 RepID=UPI000C9E8E6B|nr:hypothetical protein [Vibrio vulnificus]PNG62431.1 hypothetical protein SC81_21845 [Vibrio vulnificus]POC06515.1 hypothetical protein CRN54_20815 [Vibrio vulnificus]POC77695.1 hypothetical protein CRN61_19735 [Vibrio vulnificus]